jgi:hypothetical protein
MAGTLTEVGHHGTQIGALRDLYVWRHIDHDRALLVGPAALAHAL